MELINNNSQWFLSTQGQTVFENCKNIEDRSVFVYSYLKTISAESLEKDSFLFRIAFLISDAIYNSNTQYSSFPEILNSDKNPFVAYVKNAKKVYSIEANYCILLSILHGIADPFNASDWIYDQSLFEKEGYVEKIKEFGKCFIENKNTVIVDVDDYAIDESLRFIQIELAWLFIFQKKEGK